MTTYSECQSPSVRLLVYRWCLVLSTFALSSFWSSQSSDLRPLKLLKLVTLHDLFLVDTTSLNGVESESENRHSQRNLLVARDGSRSDKAASLALGVDDGTTITFRANADAAKRDQARSARLAATLEIHAANTGLCRSKRTAVVRAT